MPLRNAERKKPQVSRPATRAVRPELQKDFLAHNTRLSPLGVFLEVLILGTFKSLKMEVLILRELRMRFA